MHRTGLEGLSSLLDRVVASIDLTPMGIAREGTVLSTDGHRRLLASVAISDREMPTEAMLGSQFWLSCRLLHFQVHLVCRVGAIQPIDPPPPVSGRSQRTHVELFIDEVAALAA